MHATTAGAARRATTAAPAHRSARCDIAREGRRGPQPPLPVRTVPQHPHACRAQRQEVRAAMHAPRRRQDPLGARHVRGERASGPAAAGSHRGRRQPQRGGRPATRRHVRPARSRAAATPTAAPAATPTVAPTATPPAAPGRTRSAWSVEGSRRGPPAPAPAPCPCPCPCPLPARGVPPEASHPCPTLPARRPSPPT